MSQRVLLALVAAVMVLVAVRMLRRSGNSSGPAVDATGRLGQMGPATGRFAWTLQTASVLAGIGALTGFKTGLLGVGGGFVIVPLLRRFTALTMHGIVATSLLVIAIFGFGGVVTALLHGAALPWVPTLLFVATGLLAKAALGA